MFPKIVVVTGVDGSGKTTQTQLLKKFFQQKGVTVGLVQQFDSETIFGKEILKKMGPYLIQLERGVSDKSYFNKNTNKRKSFAKRVFKFFALNRILIVGFYHTWIKILKNREKTILIYDRYYYDDLIKAKWMYNVSNRIEAVVLKFVIQPSILFYLDVPPEIACSREFDGDTTLEQHIVKKEMYDEWFELLKKRQKNVHKINTNQDPQQSHNEIISVINTEVL